MSRFKTYDQFVSAVKGLLAINQIQVDEVGWLNYSLNSRLEEIRQAAKWPDVAVIEERTPVSGLIEWAQTDETEIAKVWGVYDKNPLDGDGYCEIRFDETRDGIKLMVETTGNVFVEYTPVYEELADADISDIEIPSQVFQYCVLGAIADYWYARDMDYKGDRFEGRALRKAIDAKKGLSIGSKRKDGFIVKSSISERLD